MVDHPHLEELVDAAREVAKRAHAPYSNFRVGAAVLAADGSVHVGCNVENAAYGSTICAEVNAVTTAIAHGATELVAIGVAALDGENVYPCGNCRQVMREFGIDTVVVETTDGPRTYSSDDLFPHSFGPEDLGEREPPGVNSP